MTRSEVKIYQLEDGKAEIQVKLDNDTIWLSQKQMAEFFDKDTDTIGLHLKNIYESSELEEYATTEEYSVVQLERSRKVKRKITFYNLDAIISGGYCVNSKRGVLFRIWASNILKNYLIQGFSLNEKKLIEQSQQLKDLQQSVKILGNIISQKELSSDENRKNQ